MAEVVESCPLLGILVPTCLQWDSLGNQLRRGFVVRIILESGLRNMGVPCGAVVKNPQASAGDAGLIPGSGRSPEEGNGNPPVFLPGNPTDRGTWRATIHRVTNSQTRLMIK